MVAVEVGRPPGLRVSLSRRRRLLARRPPAGPVVVLLAVVQLLVAARVPAPVRLVAAQVPVLRLAVLWGWDRRGSEGRGGWRGCGQERGRSVHWKLGGGPGGGAQRRRSLRRSGRPELLRRRTS